MDVFIKAISLPWPGTSIDIKIFVLHEIFRNAYIISFMKW